MWFLVSWLLGSDDSEDTDSIDTDLLYEVGEQWLQDATQGDDETASAKWQAVEHIEEESGGGFWSWLTGK